MKAVITSEFTDAAEARLRSIGVATTRAGWGVTGESLTDEAMIGAIVGAQILVTEHDPVSASVLDASPDLEVIAVCRGTPVGIDLAAAAAHGVTVINTPARNADAVADFTIACLLDLTRHIAESDRHHRAAGWLVAGQMPYLHFRGRELSRLTLGIVGLGATGQRVAQRARDGFGMRILANTRTPRAIDGVTCTSLPDLLEQSDVVSLHCSVTPQTTGLIDAEALRKMQPTAYLINMARGAVVDTAALIEALHAGEIAGAALDVYDPEPPPADSTLFDAPNLLLTPHIAGASDDVVHHHSEMVADDIERWIKGQAPRHQV